MKLTVEQMEFLAAKGLSLTDVIEFAKMSEGQRSANAERQARYRQRRKAEVSIEPVTDAVTESVTRNVTDNDNTPLSLPPNENISNPPTHTPGDNTPARKGTGAVAKPDGVTDQVWRDFLAHRKAKRATVTPTVIAGIGREAEKAGWAMDAALAECVTRGWQTFRADWVGPPAQTKSGGSGQSSDYLDALIAKRIAPA